MASPIPSIPEGVTLRPLPADEYSRFANVPPFDKIGLPDPSTSWVLIGEDPQKKIVLYWFVYAALHVEPLWIAEEYQTRPRLILRAWQEVKGFIAKTSAKMAFAMLRDPALAAMAVRLGFERAPWELYYVSTREEQPRPGNGHDAEAPPPVVESH